MRAPDWRSVFAFDADADTFIWAVIYLVLFLAVACGWMWD